MPVIDQNKFYNILDELFFCCDEQQFRYVCKKCEEYMGCQFCTFNPYEACDCSE